MGTKLTWAGLVMVNIMCQLDGATGCPDMWSNIVLGVSVWVFLGDQHLNWGTE